MKKNWKLQCLICKHSRKTSDNAFITCKHYDNAVKIYYGSDMFTGFIKCVNLEMMDDPFTKKWIGKRRMNNELEKGNLLADRP